ncbi:MAG: hypothetical protein LBT89_07825, partial [Planctomycetaceae bacterium]|nr:hypothetical protein [Planctomycetaceae bacterium]
MTGYLTELGNQEMSTEGTSVNSASDNTTDKAKLEAARRGVLSTKSHEVKYFKAKEGGNGTVDKNSIYGRQAD